VVAVDEVVLLCPDITTTTATTTTAATTPPTTNGVTRRERAAGLGAGGAPAGPAGGAGGPAGGPPAPPAPAPPRGGARGPGGGRPTPAPAGRWWGRRLAGHRRACLSIGNPRAETSVSARPSTAGWRGAPHPRTPPRTQPRPTKTGCLRGGGHSGRTPRPT